MKRKVQSAKLRQRNGKFFASRFSLLASSAFTLVELLVVIAIFSVITGIAVLSNAAFNSSVLLTNLAYEVGLSVREAQVYGVSVHSAASGCVDQVSCFDSVYGVDFNTNTPTQYIFFSNAGVLNNGIYDYSYTYSVASDPINDFTIGQGFSIKKIFCNGVACSDVGIAFQRPNLDTYVNGILGESAEICIQDPTKTTSRGILVGATGQISVVNDGSCN